MVSLFGKIFLPHLESLYPESEVDGIVPEHKSVIVLTEFPDGVVEAYIGPGHIKNFIETTIFRLLKHNLTVILACGFHMNGG